MSNVAELNDLLRTTIRVGRLDLRVVSHYESTCPNCGVTMVFMENPQLTNMDQVHCKHCNVILKLEDV